MQDYINLCVDALALIWGLNCLFLVLGTLFSIVGSAFCKNSGEFKSVVDRIFMPVKKLEKFFAGACLILLTVLVALRILNYFG